MAIDPVNSSAFPARPTGPPPPAQTPADSFAAALARAEQPARPIADGPPPEAIESVQLAGEVYAQLRATDRELRFEATPHGVKIAVFDGDGKLIQRVPATDVLRMADGEKTWLA